MINVDWATVTSIGEYYFTTMLDFNEMDDGGKVKFWRTIRFKRIHEKGPQSSRNCTGVVIPTMADSSVDVSRQLIATLAEIGRDWAGNGPSSLQRV